MKIAGYLRTSLIEWPGKISSVIFTPGCNFACPFCHNRDLVDSSRVKKLPSFKEDEVLSDLQSRKKWIDAVVFSGGEPTLQSGLEDFLAKVKKAGFETMIETNGSNPEVLGSLIKKRLLDSLAMDYKTSLAGYRKMTKFDSKDLEGKIKKSIILIIKSGLPFELRTTVVPTIHDEKVLVKMAQELRRLSSEIRWRLQTFRPENCLNPKFSQKRPFSRQQMANFLLAVQKIVPRAKWPGIDS